MPPAVHTVSLSPTHSFSKIPQPSIHLLAGLGVQGDAHAGANVQHLYHIRKNPNRPNLSQVHLLPFELFAELALSAEPALFAEPNLAPLQIHPGDMGENITTTGLDLLALPLSTRLHLGPSAIVELTGLRTPCVQMDRFRPGLMAAVFTKDAHGKPTPRAGVMAIVLSPGQVHPNDPIHLDLPAKPHHPLQRL